MNDESADLRVRLEQALQDDAGESTLASKHQYLRFRPVDSVHGNVTAPRCLSGSQCHVTSVFLNRAQEIDAANLAPNMAVFRDRETTKDGAYEHVAEFYNNGARLDS